MSLERKPGDVTFVDEPCVWTSAELDKKTGNILLVDDSFVALSGSDDERLQLCISLADVGGYELALFADRVAWMVKNIRWIPPDSHDVIE